jgi:hypothetical protein
VVDADDVEDLASDEVDQLLDAGGAGVEAGAGREDDRAFFGELR